MLQTTSTMYYVSKERYNIKQPTLSLCIHLGALRGKSADRSNDPTSDQHGTDMGSCHRTKFKEGLREATLKASSAGRKPSKQGH